jgi:hypothetical protein
MSPIREKEEDQFKRRIGPKLLRCGLNDRAGAKSQGVQAAPGPWTLP